MRRLWLTMQVVLAGCVLLGCAGRTPWPVYQMQWLTTAEPEAAFEAVLSYLRVSGYEVVEFDDQRLFIRIRARVDQDVVLREALGQPQRSAVRRESYFNIQLHPDGRLQIGASGYHLRGGTIDPRLDAELRRLVADVYGCLPDATGADGGT
ncbi:MAG: hypothetical protein HY907_06715 [Deltaproteobacteria bacterium]|nr:hypothetical protein [Deltaproteobacteria bacterium]